MGMVPAFNDDKFDLLFKQAQNWYDHAIVNGLIGLTPPNLSSDNEVSLMAKIAYYTARIADAS